MRKNITLDFYEDEFMCHCGCGGIKFDRKLVDYLQMVRTAIKKAITVTSGYRCIKHNLAEGGSSNSFHVQGKAADIRISKGKGIDALKTLYYACECIGKFNGLGAYPDADDLIVHCDVGERFQRWVYRNGVYVYLF